MNNGYYDSTTKEIVLSLTTAEGNKEVRIKVADLIHSLDVNNGTNNPIVLSVEHTDDGDVLSAKINISTEEHNLILTDNGTLYASNQAKDHTGLWNGEEKTVQYIIEQIKTETDKVEDLVKDVADVKSDVSGIKLDVVKAQSDIETLNGKVAENAEKIATNTGAINALSSQVTELAGEVHDAMGDFDELEDTVKALDTKVSTYESRIAGLEARMTSTEETLTNLKKAFEDYKAATDARLDVIEDIVNNLIDFGEE